MTTLLVILILLNVATLLMGWRLYRRETTTAGDAEMRDVMEKSRWLLEMEAKERWTALDLDRLHPVNRQEVEMLLGRLDGGSTRALTGQERTFLDRMVEAERRASRTAAPKTKRAVTGP